MHISPRWLLILTPLLVHCTPSIADLEPSETDGTEGTDLVVPGGSAGCGRSLTVATGGVNQSIDAGAQGDGERSYHLVLPAAYDPTTPHQVVVGYAGTNWVGEQIRPYLDLERHTDRPTIFVYPDPLWRDFTGWGNLGGWVLGPHASPADGEGDLVFTDVLLDDLEANYCVKPDRIYVTGHSWGGDMAAVTGCFLGDRVAASAPVAANRPYWFETGNGMASCQGSTPTWTFFGVADDHFTWQGRAGQFGDEQRDFWLDENQCDGSHAYTWLPQGSGSECVDFSGCETETLYCLYGPQTGHQAPSYYSETVMQWFDAQP